MAENVGNIYYEIDMDVRGLLSAQQQVNRRLDALESGFDGTTRAVAGTERSMSGLSKVAVALATALSARQIGEYADAWANLSNKLANSLRPNEQLIDVTERVFNITQQTRSSLGATASLYSRLERATRQYGTSTEDIARLTTIINQGFVVSGASAQEAENAIIQLSQGLASGALRGDEFNSVNENGNRLMVALADSMGVTIGQMRQLAADGKLTTEVIVNGLLSQGSAIGAEFAKTTATISQSMQTAGNNITKFFGENSTVKTGVAIFNNAIVSISENIGALSGVLTAVAAVMGSRYVGALTLATAQKLKGVVASRNLAAAEALEAQASANKAAADLRSAAVAKERALDEIRLAEMQKQSAISATNSAAAEQRLSAARVAAAGAVDNYNRALAANRVAQSGLVAGGSLLSRGLSLIGGPAGAAMLAASAIIYFSQRAKEARDNANNLADSVNELSSKFQTMSNTELSASIAKMSQTLPELNDAVDDAQDKFNAATAAVQRQQREIDNWGTNTTRGRQAAEALGGAQDELAVATLELERAQNRLSQTQNGINIGRATLNGTMRQGIDLLRRDGEEAGVAAGMMGKLGDMINFAAKEKDKFNASSLVVERPKDVQEYLDKQQEQVNLQSELNDRKREQLRAEQDIRKLGGSDADVRLARDRAAAEFDAKKAQQDSKRATKDAASEASKYGNQQESIAQKLANLKQQAELAAGSTSELSREQQLLAAEQSLGAHATDEQKKKAREYKAAAIDAASAAKGVTEALKAIPEQAENKSYADSMQNLKAALNAGKIDLQEYNISTERMAAEHQANLAKIRADQAVTPQQEAVGGVDPVQQLANENARKIALINQYEQQGLLAHQNALALRNEADTLYEQQRIAAQWEIWKNQSTGNQMLAAGFESLAGNASNAFTGILTGSMSAQEAMQSLASNALNSLINGFVQMGIDWVKSAVMGSAAQTSAIATTTAAQAAGLATTTATSTASAATTMAAWTPAAAVASIGSFGGAAAIGIAALVAALAMAGGLAGKRKNGGPVSAGSMYQVGEGGMPEIYRASTGKQYMIPGDNGRVISNKDISGGSSGGIVVYNNVQNYTSSSVDSQSRVNNDGSITIDTIVADINQGGRISQAIQNNHQAPRKARE
ncbi:phage tail length tape-measure protein [Trabulsiella guamensis ATCC 49490]|uniref:Phage tail length tape-measure protein n=1 Tax=Trabulsiella guamensis ATCC 49490 TaxID=1005994 RepID=A0A085APX2_9ENTR|nr:tape measure protein [Trabulsiella guamensis]KFC12267.1 phage tail length tape-measure protein [Trabulsiella guamensis ATCC 49490]